MSETIIPGRFTPHALAPSGRLTGWMKGALFQRLERLREGQVTVVDGATARRFGEPGDLQTTLTVGNRRFYGDVVFGGSLGAAESYINGHWTCDDLTALIRIFARNLDVSDGLEQGWARLLKPLAKAGHWLRRNTRKGSQRNIQAHYDLGNEFFELFLDGTMNYSCGIFESPESTLRQASIAKMERICRKLDLQPGDHLLEIGSGWGALAIHAASRFGCRVTTTTISEEQFEKARERVRQAGLEDRVTVLLSDYRHLKGSFDKIVSVEMIEAVGHEFLDTYFGQCSRLLKPEGLMLLQGIVMADHRYEQYRKSVDFIQRYVFPGSCLPSLTAICNSLARTTDMRTVQLEDLTPHYAETLRRWRCRFFGRVEGVRNLGFPDSFIRLWDFYLCYCEAGFEERTIGDVQLLFAKPRNRRTALLPGLGDAEPAN